MNELRYHFMYKEREAVSHKIIIQLMDFKEGILVRGSMDQLLNMKNEQLRSDIQSQWDYIKNSPILGEEI
ncbi:hypothetical protein A374_05666 [Fictibacillus macauensis ZFHKF-1]|uniref:Uncharacterized protein n=1 Tax=Fictibacillus macauensis ZFHKF-1 TaxID=1196324 RepID=I8UHN9_9BACL|nr:hypothetical protein [Fictibacillus macauensis]EIT86425.1 hypothetical protein A374_05666 [Fictibacillus macauensis ZFHKF-1]